MKVLLIDDEPLARIGLRSVIPWESNGFTIVGEAENGAEGLRIAEQHRPDLILVDLIMPEMGGLEFIRRVKKLLPDCKIIIMTCMSGTEYYREAIRCGVSEYIEKDRIDPEEILEAVKRVAGEIRRERVISEEGESGWIVNENVVLTEFLNLVLQGRISDSEGVVVREKLAGRMDLSAGRFVAVTLRRGEDPAGIADSALLDCSVLSLCQEIVSRTAGGFLFCAFDGGIAGILCLPGDLHCEDYSRRLFQQMAETAEQCVDCSLTGGMSDLFDDPKEFGAAYRKAVEALERRFFGGCGQLYLYKETAPENEDARKIAQQLLQCCLAADTLASFQAALVAAEDLPDALAKSGLTVPKAKSMYADLLYHLRSLLRREELELERFFDDGFPAGYLEQDLSATALHRRIAALTMEVLQSHRLRETKTSGVIPDIQQYVARHLNERITLDALASQVFLSSSYVCRLYKRETGENLQSYILRHKLERAKQLLLQQSVGMTADALGFHSHSYFIRVFKEEYGLTPQQYQRQI